MEMKLNLKLYRIPRLRPPTFDGFLYIADGQCVEIIRRFPPITLTPRCFFTHLHPIPKLKEVFER